LSDLKIKELLESDFTAQNMNISQLKAPNYLIRFNSKVNKDLSRSSAKEPVYHQKNNILMNGNMDEKIIKVYKIKDRTDNPNLIRKEIQSKQIKQDIQKKGTSSRKNRNSKYLGSTIDYRLDASNLNSQIGGVENELTSLDAQHKLVMKRIRNYRRE